MLNAPGQPNVIGAMTAYGWFSGPHLMTPTGQFYLYGDT